MIKVKSKNQSIQLLAITIFIAITLIAFFSLNKKSFKSPITPKEVSKELETKENLNRKLENEIISYKNDIEKYTQKSMSIELFPTQGTKFNGKTVENKQNKKKVQPFLKLEAVIYGQGIGVAIIDGVAVNEGAVLKTGEILKNVSKESVTLSDAKGKFIRTLNLETLKTESNYLINTKE